jgi:hypothetical protein
VRALRAEDGDPTSALAYLDEACALEHPQGCLLAGELYRERDALRDIEVALERYRSGCVAGEALACRQAGLVELRRGSGEEAAALLDRGCLRGDRISCTKLAAVWRQGRAGHERSPHMAYSLYRRACRSGGAAGCLEVAKMYRHGAPPVLRSRERAVTFAKRACRAGSREGCALVEEASSREAVAIFEASEGAVRRALGVVSTSMQLVGIGRGIDVRDRAAIGAIVEMHGSHLEHCFESHVREDASSDVEAIEIAVGVELAGGGYSEVIDAKVLESSIGDAHLERCITSEFELMHFPLPRGVWRGRVRRFVYPLSHVRGE